MKINVLNVNGIRFLRQKGLLSWLAKEAPDVLCLQETKASPDVLGPDILKDHGYHCVWASAEKKGYSGTSTWSKLVPDETEVGLGIERFDREGRTVVTTHGPLTIFNGYFPNGQADPWSSSLQTRLYSSRLGCGRTGSSPRSVGRGLRRFQHGPSSDRLARPKAMRNQQASCLSNAQPSILGCNRDGWIAFDTFTPTNRSITVGGETVAQPGKEMWGGASTIT